MLGAELSGRHRMIGWIARILMAAAGVVTGWFIAKDQPSFGLVQATVAMLLLVFLVLVFAYWPSRRDKRTE